jgi:hypothetical protein
VHPLTIPLILTTGFRHWLFSIFLEKAFLHRRLQCSSHYHKSEAQNFAGGSRDSEPRTQAPFI